MTPLWWFSQSLSLQLCGSSRSLASCNANCVENQVSPARKSRQRVQSAIGKFFLVLFPQPSSDKGHCEFLSWASALFCISAFSEFRSGKLQTMLEGMLSVSHLIHFGRTKKKETEPMSVLIFSLLFHSLVSFPLQEMKPSIPDENWRVRAKDFTLNREFGKLRKLRLRAWICLTPLATIQTPQLRAYVCLSSQAVCDREVWWRDPISTTIPRPLPPKTFLRRLSTHHEGELSSWSGSVGDSRTLAGNGNAWRETQQEWKTFELEVYLDPVIWNLCIVFVSLLRAAGHSKIAPHVARCTTSSRMKTLPFQWFFFSQAKCHRNHYQTLVLSDLQRSHGNKHHFRSSTIKANDFGLTFQWW